MDTMEEFSLTASEESLARAVRAFEQKWVRVTVVNSWVEAKMKALELIPKNSEVMNMTSVTLTQIGLDTEITDSGAYVAVRNMFTEDGMNKLTKRRLWTAHEWAIWSVHAVTEDGIAIIASATGGQLSSYAFWATHILWIIWTQKIVKDLDTGMRRLYEYVLPLENERALKAYGVWSAVNKLLIIHKEEIEWRIHIIFVREPLWF